MIFQYHIAKMTPSALVHIWTCRVYHFPIPAVWKCTGSDWISFHNHQRQQYVRGAECTPFLNLASSQSGTGMNKNADAGTSLIPD
jgi:hypothetical protein